LKAVLANYSLRKRRSVLFEKVVDATKFVIDKRQTP
jgi:hypothetical protein